MNSEFRIESQWVEIRLLLRRVVWINSTCFHEVRVVVEASRVCVTEVEFSAPGLQIRVHPNTDINSLIDSILKARAWGIDS
jgi:hypothetical protein